MTDPNFETLPEQDSLLEDSLLQPSLCIPSVPSFEHTPIVNEFQLLIISLNKSGMEQLHKNNYNEARRLLLQAEQTLKMAKDVALSVTTLSQDLSSNIYEKRKQFLGLTYNNLGCVERQALNFEKALHYLKKALQYECFLETDSEEHVALNNSAGTILNICVVLSKLGQHQQAYQYAKSAIQKLNITLKSFAEISNQILDQSIVQTMVQTAVYAHFNAGVEAEYLRLWHNAREHYETALSLAKIAISAHDPVHEKIRRALAKANMQVRNKVQNPPLRQANMIKTISFDTMKEASTKKQFPPKKSPRRGEQTSLNALIRRLDHEYLSVVKPRHKHSIQHITSPQHKLPWDFKITDKQSNEFITQQVNSLPSNSLSESANKQLNHEIFSSVKEVGRPFNTASVTHRPSIGYLEPVQSRIMNTQTRQRPDVVEKPDVFDNLMQGLMPSQYECLSSRYKVEPRSIFKSKRVSLKPILKPIQKPFSIQTQHHFKTKRISNQHSPKQSPFKTYLATLPQPDTTRFNTNKRFSLCQHDYTFTNEQNSQFLFEYEKSIQKTKRTIAQIEKARSEQVTEQSLFEPSCSKVKKDQKDVKHRDVKVIPLKEANPEPTPQIKTLQASLNIQEEIITVSQIEEKDVKHRRRNISPTMTEIPVRLSISEKQQEQTLEESVHYSILPCAELIPEQPYQHTNHGQVSNHKQQSQKDSIEVEEIVNQLTVEARQSEMIQQNPIMEPVRDQSLTQSVTWHPQTIKQRNRKGHHISKEHFEGSSQQTQKTVKRSMEKFIMAEKLLTPIGKSQLKLSQNSPFQSNGQRFVKINTQIEHLNQRLGDFQNNLDRQRKNPALNSNQTFEKNLNDAVEQKLMSDVAKGNLSGNSLESVPCNSSRRDN